MSEMVLHECPFYSLDTMRVVDLRGFMRSFSNIRNREIASESSFFADCKVVGTDIALYYSEGVLTSAVTRGDGVQGVDVTEIIQGMTTVPKRLVKDINVLIYGTVTVYNAELYILNEYRDGHRLKPFKSINECVDIALGDSEDSLSARKVIRLYAYDMLRLDVDSQLTHIERYTNLLSYGFSVVLNSGNTPLTTESDILGFISTVNRMVSDLPFSIEGVVVKQNSPACAYEVNSRASSHTSEHSLDTCKAYACRKLIRLKMDMTHETVVKSVEWRIGKANELYPIIHIRPISVNDHLITEIATRAGRLLRLGKPIDPDSTIKVCQSHMNPPEILEVISTPTDGEVTLIDKCPFCGADVEMDGNNLYCTNHRCRAALAERVISLVHVVTGDDPDIQFSREQLESLVTSNTIENLDDLFRPCENKSPLMTQRDLDELVASLQQITYSQLVDSLGIRDFIMSIRNLFCIGTKNLENCIVLLSAPDGIQYNIRWSPPSHVIRHITSWWGIKDNQDMLKRINELHLPNC